MVETGYQNASHDANDTTHITELLDDLKNRTQTILQELEVFKQHLKTIRQESTVETAHYHGTVRSELAMLERLCQKQPEQNSYHIAKSSNLPFLEKVWTTVKLSRRLVALQKRIHYPSGSKSSKPASKPISRRRRLRRGSDIDASCVVDAVVDGGDTWIKISLINNNRLLFDLAKQGWEVGDSASDSDELNTAAPDDEFDLPIVKSAKELAAAAQYARIRTRHPRVVLMLPRVTEGETNEIDRVVEQCRAAGVVVVCGNNNEHVPSISETLTSMAPDPFSTFSEVLNIDCTILLAIVSEFSHAQVSKEPWFHTALKRQVEIEGNENLLPSMLYPAMGNHKLVCTREAATRMHEIVDTIGTASEKARTAIMMSTDKSKTQADLVLEMQQWSEHEVPSDWQLPIHVVEQNEDDCQSTLPEVVLEVTAAMTSINKSIFLHGWATGRTTITSNRTIVKQIENDFDKYDDMPESVWPNIWLCPTARSLVGKEKRRAC